MCHSVVEVEETDWVEPILVWITVCMPTGSGKSSLCKLLNKLVEDARTNVGSDSALSWLADDQSLENMGALMNENNGRLLGLYDELSMFFSQMNIFHAWQNCNRFTSIFLQLFGAKVPSPGQVFTLTCTKNASPSLLTSPYIIKKPYT